MKIIGTTFKKNIEFMWGINYNRFMDLERSGIWRK